MPRSHLPSLFLLSPPPPRSTLFPYTTLFRSMINDSTSAFCYAVCKDGKAFGAPIVIPRSSNIEPHGENLPKIIFKPSRSEEHTSELQSPYDLVCRLLLEKKKTIKTTRSTTSK